MFAGLVDTHGEPQDLSWSACTVLRAGHTQLGPQKPVVHKQMGVSSQFTPCELLPHHLAVSSHNQTLRVNLEIDDTHMDDA